MNTITTILTGQGYFSRTKDDVVDEDDDFDAENFSAADWNSFLTVGPVGSKASTFLKTMKHVT